MTCSLSTINFESSMCCISLSHTVAYLICFRLSAPPPPPPPPLPHPNSTATAPNKKTHGWHMCARGTRNQFLCDGAAVVYPTGVGRVRRAPQMLSGIWSSGSSSSSSGSSGMHSKSAMNCASFVSPLVSTAARKYRPIGQVARALIIGRCWTEVHPSDIEQIADQLCTHARTHARTITRARVHARVCVCVRVCVCARARVCACLCVRAIAARHSMAWLQGRR